MLTLHRQFLFIMSSQGGREILATCSRTNATRWPMKSVSQTSQREKRGRHTEGRKGSQSLTKTM